MSEEELLRKQRSYKIPYLIAILLVPVLGIYFWQSFYRYWVIPVVLFILLLCILSYADSARKKYKNIYFANVYGMAMAETFEDVKISYLPQGNALEQVTTEIMGVNLQYIPDNCYLEPAIVMEGKYHNLFVRLYEYYVIQLVEKRGKATTEEKLIYEGYFLGVQLPESFTGEVQIHSTADVNYGRVMEKIQLEDIEFNKTFSTFATTQKDAFRILQPKTMLLFKDIYKKMNPKKRVADFDVCFINGFFCTCKAASNTRFRVPFFSLGNIEKCKKKVRVVSGWIEEVVNDFKLETERYTTGR